MHILSSDNRAEFLVCPQLVKLDYAMGQDGFEPTLLIKGSTLLLKYIVAGVDLRFVVARISDRVLYGLLINDDPDKPAILWSVVEKDEELKALTELCDRGRCPAFLFNELAVNVAWTTLPISLSREGLLKLCRNITLGRADYALISQKANVALDQLLAGQSSGFITSHIDGVSDWKRLNNVLITNKANRSPIDIFGADEGSQQEQLAIWLTDNLHPSGAHHSPQVPSGPRKRELTDVLLTYEYGAFLFESKALELQSRVAARDRAKLSQAMAKHVKKALKQLQGSIRSIKSGVEVASLSGEVIRIERERPAHAIILVPDLDLLDDEACSVDLAVDFMRKTGGFLHLLDVSELLRMVQAAEMIAAASAMTTPMMAFDYYLMERAKKMIEAGTMRFSMLFRNGKV